MPLVSSACPISAPHHTNHGHPGRQPPPPDRILSDLVRLLARQAAADWLAARADATAEPDPTQH